MTTLAELRDSRTPHAARCAALSVAVPASGAALVAWLGLRGEEGYLTQTELELWLLIVAAAATGWAILAMGFWRATRARVGVVVGLGLTAVACFSGVVADLLISTS